MNLSTKYMNGHLTREKQMDHHDSSTSSLNSTGSNNNISANQKTDSRPKKRRDAGYLDVIKEKPIRVTVKVLVPVKEYPKFNFIGKLLGPKGNSLKRLQEQTTTKMAVLGRGSMRNRSKEEELRASGDPKYHHLTEDLHVEISAFSAPAEAYASIAYALAEIRPYLFPDGNDNIRKDQIRELECMSDSVETQPDSELPASEQQLPTSTNNGNHKRPNMSLFLPDEPHPREKVHECCTPQFSLILGSRSSPHSPMHGASLPSTFPPLRRKMLPLKAEPPGKRRVLSILDKAKIALDRSYGIHSRTTCEDYHYFPEEFTDTYQPDIYERPRSCWSRIEPMIAAMDRTGHRYDPYHRPSLP